MISCFRYLKTSPQVIGKHGLWTERFYLRVNDLLKKYLDVRAPSSNLRIILGMTPQNWVWSFERDLAYGSEMKRSFLGILVIREGVSGLEILTEFLWQRVRE